MPMCLVSPTRNRFTRPEPNDDDHVTRAPGVFHTNAPTLGLVICFHACAYFGPCRFHSHASALGLIKLQEHYPIYFPLKKSETNNLENPLLAVGAAGNNLPANLGPYHDRVDSPDSSNHGLPIGGQLPATDARATSPPLATHPYGTPVYAAEARTVPHFLESRIALPTYNPEPFGRKAVKIKTQNLQGVMFNGTNMEIGDFITRVERAAQGSDICLQIVFFMQGEALAKEVQEMVERENYDWEKLKERFVQRWDR
ncbi:hypothetical protein H4Q26_009130 [Puccinia striiformis f. sp. tritici PST-130]|nr:hypothetical protein H4Q26_009130 [Puccinia striiformis f. sp. tritici PST-130]